MGSIAASTLLFVLTGCAPQAARIPRPASQQQITSMMREWPRYEAGLINYNSPAALEGVSFVKFVSDSQWVAVMTACTAEYGVTDIVYHRDHTSTAEATTTTGQWARDFANGACIIKFPPVAVKKRLKTPQQLDYIYTYYKNELVPCMASEGFAVKRMPARDRFRQTSRSGLTLWSPYSALETSRAPVNSLVTSDGLAQVPVAERASDPRLVALLAKCPALPPGV